MLSMAAVLLGCVLQDPPKPQDPKPQEPPRSGDVRNEPKTGSIDPELRSAVDAFNRANGYRFHAEGRVPSRQDTLARGATQTPPIPPNTPPNPPTTDDRDKVASAKERSGAMQDIRVDGTFERGKPVSLMTDQIEAFRSGDKLVYRIKGAGEWQVLSDLGVPARAGASPTDPTSSRDRTVGGEKSIAGNDGLTAECLAKFALPSDLLENLDASVANCVRQPGGDPKGGAATFECQLRPDAMRKHFEKHGGDAAEHAAAADMMKNCTLRITVSQGKIDRLVLESGLPLSGKGELGARDTTSPPVNPPANPPTRPASETPSSSANTDVTIRYTLNDIGKAEVKVPDEAARLLGSR